MAVTRQTDFFLNKSILDFQNKTGVSTRLMDKYEVKILFAILMATLCLITTFGNICVIFRYRKASMVNKLTQILLN